MPVVRVIIVFTFVTVGWAGSASAAAAPRADRPSSVRTTYDPFALARALENPSDPDNAKAKRRVALANSLKSKVRPPKNPKPRSPHKPPAEDDDDRGHGNNEDGNDSDNPGKSQGP